MTTMELNSLPTIVDRIRQLCTELRTGTVFLVSDQNRMVQVHLERGEIALLMHRNRRGEEALRIIAGMRQARLRFDEAYVTREAQDDTLTTRAVLEFLHAAARDGGPPQAATPGMAGGADVAAGTLSAESRSAIEALLLRYIGPMAEIVCAEHFARTADPSALAHALAAEIPVAAHAARFLAEFAEVLGNSPGGSDAG